MAASVTKKFRVGPELLAGLAEVAASTGMRESEIFREGIRLQVQKLRRAAALDDLMEVLECAPPELTKFEGKA